MRILFHAKFLVFGIILIICKDSYAWRSAKWVNFDNYVILDCKDTEVGNSYPKYMPTKKKKKKFKIYLNRKDNKWSSSDLGVSNKMIAQKKATVDHYEDKESITFTYNIKEGRARIQTAFMIYFDSLNYARSSTIYNPSSTIERWAKGKCTLEENNDF